MIITGANLCSDSTTKVSWDDFIKLFSSFSDKWDEKFVGCEGIAPPAGLEQWVLSHLPHHTTGQLCICTISVTSLLINSSNLRIIFDGQTSEENIVPYNWQ